MFKFVPRQIPNNIYVIGCGGTGSRLVPLLTQFMRTVTHGVTPRGNVMSPTIYLIDDDVVETKNLLRQNFIESDVGKHKATVLASRYSRAYGVNVIPIVKRVRPQEDLFEGLDVGYVGSNCLVIMCVDSAKARRDIIQTWSNASRANQDASQQCFFVDAGNEDDFGQVRLFSLLRAYHRPSSLSALKRVPSLTPVAQEINFLPIDEDFYANLQDNPGGSCADLDQTLAINALMATLIMGVVQNFYYVKPFSYHSMSISLNGAVSSSPLTAKYLCDITQESRHSSRVFLQNIVSREIGDVILDYAEENRRALSSMGLNADGSPVKRPTPKAEATVTVDRIENLALEAFDKAHPELAQLDAFIELDELERVIELAQEEGILSPAPEAAAAPARRRTRTRPTTTAPVFPSGLSEPPPLVARR